MFIYMCVHVCKFWQPYVGLHRYRYVWIATYISMCIYAHVCRIGPYEASTSRLQYGTGKAEKEKKANKLVWRVGALICIIYKYLHIYTYAFIYIHTYVYIYIYIYICMHVYTYIILRSLIPLVTLPLLPLPHTNLIASFSHFFLWCAGGVQHT